ncbi:MAG TPA: ABC transporter ATP-binding protein, partial [Rhodospirillales bacterium]|nr:ABC transporter ATP-binding protein [Rhodospirillales bacterium]
PGEALLPLFLRPAVWRRAEADAMRRADELLTFLRLEAVADLPAGRLSGGQKKLLELGRVLMLEPKLVLLDEPFAGVNPTMVEEISTRIRELHRRGIGFFVIEHNLQALRDLAERIYVMDRGRIIAFGPGREVLADPAVREAYMGGVL